MSESPADAIEAALTSLGLNYENPRPGAFLVKLAGQLRRQAQQRGRGAQHHVRALQRLDAAREDQDDRV